jgi:hypothetical protein
MKAIYHSRDVYWPANLALAVVWAVTATLILRATIDINYGLS